MPLETTTPKPTPVPAPRLPVAPPGSAALHSRDRHPRRPSTRRSFSSATRSASLSSQHSDICRTLMAQDHDSFSYDTDQLKEWLTPTNLWLELPQSLRDRLTVVQHAGAAVLTGFERLDVLKKDMVSEGSDSPDKRDTMAVQSRMTAINLSHTRSDAPSLSHLDTRVRRPTLPIDRTRSDSVFSAGSPLAVVPPLSVGSSPSPPVSGASSPLTPMSPFANSSHASGLPLSWPTSAPSKPTSGAHSPVLAAERVFQLPQKPLAAYHREEVMQIKSDGLVRLRHTARRVDVAVLEEASKLPDGFATWWATIKEKIEVCESRVADLVNNL